MKKLLSILIIFSLAAPALAAKPDPTKEPAVARFVVATLKGLPYREDDFDPMPSADVLEYLATLKGCKFVDIDSLSREGSVGVKWDCGPNVKLKYNGVEVQLSNGKITKILPSQVSAVSF